MYRVSYYATSPTDYESWQQYSSGLQEAEQDYGLDPGSFPFGRGQPTQDRERNSEPQSPDADGGMPKSISKGNIKAAFDFDGTLASNPKLFKRLIDKITKAGGKPYLVTGRSYLDKHLVTRFCQLHGLNFREMHFYPKAYEAGGNAWDVYHDHRIGVWKASKLKEIGADFVFDDHPIHIKQILLYNPTVLIFRPYGGQ